MGIDLASATDPAWPAKIRWLARLTRAGVPVPPGVVIRLGDLGAPPALPPNTDGPWIVRSALVGEDGASASAAGLGHSVSDCRGATAVSEALRHVEAGRHDPWLVRYRGPADAKDAAIVQQQVTGPWLAVVAVPHEGPSLIECHDPGSDALARGATPRYSGDVDDWTDETAPALRQVLEAVREVVAREDGSFAHGLDVEAVCDDAGRWWVVQLRPLSRPLHPGWSDFREQVEREGDRIPAGLLTLDAEHNPAPLSEAHASLMRWLGVQRPGAGEPTILAGWLYVRSLVRDLPKRVSTAPAMTTRGALELLRDGLLPDARNELERIEATLRDATLPQLAGALNAARQAFLVMIDAYLGTLVPVRREAAKLGRVARPDAPITLSDRADYRDVLPAAWDIASPALGELSAGGDAPAGPRERALPTDPAEAMTLLTEWDDHLFALGLAPLRRVYQKAGELLGVGDDVFWIAIDELQGVVDGEASLDERSTLQRAQRHERRRRLRPPLRIRDGNPVTAHPRGDLGGVPIGGSFEGPVAQRRDLEHLIVERPSSDAIVIMPALTAPAAVALAEAGIRAVCCEYGGALSHAALMARELGLSALIGCRGCTQIPDGTHARIDTTSGRLLAAAAELDD